MLAKKPSGTVIVQSPEQKQALKEWLVNKNGGMVGWSFLTRAQAERRLARIGRWELEVIAKAQLPVNLWPGVAPWAADLCAWLRAGYPVKEIPFPESWKRLSAEVTKKILAAGEDIAAQVTARADVVLGFDPLETWGLQADAWGLIVESEEVGAAQMAQIAALERTHGPAHWCDMGEHQKKPALCVNSEKDLGPAVAEMLLQRNDLQRIVWRGPAARAAVLGLMTHEKTAESAPWINAQQLQAYRNLLERPASFSARLEYWREQVAHNKMTPAELKKVEKETAQKWETEGTLANPAEKDDPAPLPEAAAPEEFSRLTHAAIGGSFESEKLLERLAPLKRFFKDEKISRELWLELMKPPAEEASYYGGLRVVPFEKAQGLIDGETLVIWSDMSAAESRTLIDPQVARAHNAAFFKEGDSLTRGYIESDPQRLVMARKTGAQKMAPWVALAGQDLGESMTVEKRAYAEQGDGSMAQHALRQKHVTRRHPQLAFGSGDYALPTPLKISCKAWEGALVSPELAWYDILKLRPLWGAAQEYPRALWIGNWVHAAMKASVNPARIHAFFATSAGEGTQLGWREARAQAWQIALGFARALQEADARILNTELPVAGALSVGGMQISLSGRVDAVVALPGDERVVVDYKTSASATTLSEKKLKTGDGLQLWLYGRLIWQENTPPPGLCRLAYDKKLQSQMTLTKELSLAEERMKTIAASGILGQRGWVWGRFGAEERLPIAALPMDWRTVAARRKESYGTVD